MYKLIIKRVFDILFSLLFLPFVVLEILIIGAFIKVEDGGPIIYKAERIGKRGSLFTMYKLRSMKVNSPDIRLDDGSTYNADDDDRVTKVGKFIRKTSLDEFPQFINVLKGDMSVIGPRPDPPDWLDKYPKEYLEFLEVKPGITGYNQAYFRNSVDGATKMRNDLYYAKKISFILDLKIILKTIVTIMFSKNVNHE
ncbi:sugar transferase [Clostridiaceae bacterium DONG20-135]|uniref:Sugar transferase n=1 Tax=Copranaerobaculum intestinale TaxID=2692629 RepID=A0A6N8U3I3_9FIRM|nr:sugar transferase [Copranaerobaculum intestinale]MXQ72766.1 sugar transferase [Copranaerobaculum intestinale]